MWWGWHDGASARTRPKAEPYPGWWLGSLTSAVAQARWEWEEAYGLLGDQAETLLWRRSWLPIMTGMAGEHAVIDCAVAPEKPSAVCYFDREMADKFVPRAPSVGTIIGWWIDVIDAGFVSYNRSTDRWERDFARIEARYPEAKLL